MYCLMCKGTLESKLSNFIVDLDNCIIIVKNVPSSVCRQCGEVTYNHDVTLRLEKIVEQMRGNLTEVAIVHYEKIAS